MKFTTEQILERVRKLMALATSENESEAAEAMAKARRILQENGLKTQLQEEKARQTAETVSTALVLRKSEIVQATTMELYPQLNDVVLQMNDRNSSALSQGAGDGEEFSLWKGLNTPSVGGLLED